MNDNDKQKFIEIMTGLADVFPANLTKIGLNMRFDALKRFTINQVIEAANIIVKTRKYTSMPTPADFIEAIEGNQDDMADIQASLVFKAIGQFGSYNRPTFDDPITEDIMSSKINWLNLCQSPSNEVNFKLKEFRSLYKSYKKAVSGSMVNAPEEIKNIVNNSTKRIE